MASTATQAIQHPVTTATSNEGYSGEKETTEKQRRRAKKKEERKGRNADEIPEVEVEVEVEVEKKKLKGVKRKTGGAKPSDLTLSTAVEEPEGGLGNSTGLYPSLEIESGPKNIKSGQSGRMHVPLSIPYRIYIPLRGQCYVLH
jgi:hypothetical protein